MTTVPSTWDMGDMSGTYDVPSHSLNESPFLLATADRIIAESGRDISGERIFAGPKGKIYLHRPEADISVIGSSSEQWGGLYYASAIRPLVASAASRSFPLSVSDVSGQQAERPPTLARRIQEWFRLRRREEEEIREDLRDNWHYGNAFLDTEDILRSFRQLVYTYKVSDQQAECRSTPAGLVQQHLQRLQAEAVGEHPDPESRYPTSDAFVDARKFAARLDLNSYEPPIVTMAGDGEINFFWHRESDGLKVDLGFYGTGTYSCYARKGDREVFADDVRVVDGLRGDIAALLPEE